MGFVTFQKPTTVKDYKKTMLGRTFEETFIYENIQLFRDGEINMGEGFLDSKNYESEYQSVYERVKSSSFKKTEFTLDIASCSADWTTPKYIADGLHWLENKTELKTLDETIK